MIKEKIIAAIATVIQKNYPELNAGDIHLEVPQNKDHGDFSTNFAMKNAKRLGTNPRELAQKLSDQLKQECSQIESVSVAGPGFINFFLSKSFWIDELSQIFSKKESFSHSSQFIGKKALVEFVSANPTGPLHIGHGRNAVTGDVISRLLKAAGYNVTKEYYVNDGGIQITTLGKSVWFRIRQLKGENVEFPENAYVGDYIKDLAQRVLDEKWDLSLPEDALIQKLGRFAGDTILDEIKADLERTGIVFDRYFFESTLYSKNEVEKTLHALAEKNLTYQKEGATWLASTNYGDDKDRVLIKSDGSFTYLTPDIAYHREKYSRGYDLFINIWGADHGGYVPRLKAALTGLGLNTEALHVILIQMVSLIKDGQQVSMSTRRAQYETLEDVVKAVGKDVTRYFFMMRSTQAQLDFDLDLATKKTSENPAYYIQYAHARICSIFEKAKAAGFQEKGEYSPQHGAHLSLPEEIDLAKKLLAFPEAVEIAAREIAPHKIAYYVLEVAQMFQAYYDKGRADERYKVISEDKKVVEAKLFLIESVRIVLHSCLEILGLAAPSKM